MAPNSKITDVVHNLLEGLHSISKSETIIGDAYKLGDATLVPVHRLRVGIGAGALAAGGRKDAAKGESGGGGAGGTVQIDPVAVIAVGRDGVPRILSVEVEEENAMQALASQLPDIAAKALAVFTNRVDPLLNKLADRVTEKIGPAQTATAEPAQLAEGETKLLSKLSV